MWCRHGSKARHKLESEFLWTSLKDVIMEGFFSPFSSCFPLNEIILLSYWRTPVPVPHIFLLHQPLAAQEFLRVNNGFDLSVAMGNMSNILIQLLSCCSSRAPASPGKCFQLHQLSVQSVLAPDKSLTWGDASMPILCNQYWTNLCFSRVHRACSTFWVV